MSCMCSDCREKLHVVSVGTVVGTNLVLTFADAPTGVLNKDKFSFRFGVELPSGVTNLTTLQCTINGSLLPLRNKYGNLLLVEDLVRCQNGKISKNFIYQGYYGTDAPTHLIINAIPLKKIPCHC